MKPAELPPVEVLREIFDYDPQTGVMTKKATGYTGQRRWDARSGEKNGIYMNYTPRGGKLRHLAVHRIAMTLMGHTLTPDILIDHHSGDPFDNTYTNLRMTDDQGNSCNTKARKNKKGGLPKGCYQTEGEKGFKSYITRDGKTIYLGYHKTPEAAHAAYCEAAERIHGEFARFS